MSQQLCTACGIAANGMHANCQFTTAALFTSPGIAQQLRARAKQKQALRSHANHDTDSTRILQSWGLHQRAATQQQRMKSTYKGPPSNQDSTPGPLRAVDRPEKKN